jgi:hypothetical protein
MINRAKLHRRRTRLFGAAEVAERSNQKHIWNFSELARKTIWFAENGARERFRRVFGLQEHRAGTNLARDRPEVPDQRSKSPHLGPRRPSSRLRVHSRRDLGPTAMRVATFFPLQTTYYLTVTPTSRKSSIVPSRTRPAICRRLRAGLGLHVGLGILIKPAAARSRLPGRS